MTTQTNTQNICIERLDGQVISYTLYSVTREAIDEYVEAMIEMVVTQHPDQPICVLHNLTDRNIVITPYFKSRVEDVRAVLDAGNLIHKTAFVVQNSTTGIIMKTIARALSNGMRQSQTQFFLRHEEALRWLHEG